MRRQVRWMAEERAPDPLTAFISRSLRAEVSEVREEIVRDWPEVLVHGALGRGNTALADRGVVLLEWRMASLGSGLTDVVRLARDAGVAPLPLAELYAAESGRALTPAALAAASDLL